MIDPGAIELTRIFFGAISRASIFVNEISAAFVNFGSGLAAMIATIASLTLAAQHCPRRAEGFAFAGLMSISNLADICSINVGAFLYEHVFDNGLGPLIVVSAASTAVALVLVPLLDLETSNDQNRSSAQERL